MVDFLMLGIIPGTNIQINFSNWLIVSSVFGECLIVVLAIRHRRELAAACVHLFRYMSIRFWLAVLRLQLAWKLRRSAILW